MRILRIESVYGRSLLSAVRTAGHSRLMMVEGTIQSPSTMAALRVFTSIPSSTPVTTNSATIASQLWTALSLGNEGNSFSAIADTRSPRWRRIPEAE